MSAKFSFFGKVDKNKLSNRITSEYPAWMLGVHRDELAESIARHERAIESDSVPWEQRLREKEELAKEKKRLNEIEKSKPKLTGPQLERVEKEYKGLEVKIGNTLFTLSDMKRGTADAHEEMRRMVSKIIKIEDAEVAEACNITPDVSGLVTRNEASKMFKIIGAYIGAPTNVETLRKAS